MIACLHAGAIASAAVAAAAPPKHRIAKPRDDVITLD